MTTKPKYPVRALSLGAGVQSTTILRMMIAGEIEPADHVIFADTGWEPKPVYENVKKMQELAESAGMQFHIVKAGNMKEDALDPEAKFVSLPLHIYTKDGRKAMGRRTCTRNYKILPLLEKERELAGLAPFQRSKQHRLTCIIGISWDESERMRDPAFSWIRNEYPLVDLRITREQCLKWNEEQGFPTPPRSACIGCPYHSNTEWLNIKENDPESWQDAIQFEKDLQKIAKTRFGSDVFLHNQRVPLQDVVLTKKGESVNLFGQECEGMCGL